MIRRLLRSKRAFSNAVIVYCIGYMSVYLAACLVVLARTGTNPSTCVTVAGGFFGGELLAVCLAYVFKSRRDSTESDKKRQDWSDNV